MKIDARMLRDPREVTRLRGSSARELAAVTAAVLRALATAVHRALATAMLLRVGVAGRTVRCGG